MLIFESFFFALLASVSLGNKMDANVRTMTMPKTIPVQNLLRHISFKTWMKIPISTGKISQKLTIVSRAQRLVDTVGSLRRKVPSLPSSDAFSLIALPLSSAPFSCTMAAFKKFCPKTI